MRNLIKIIALVANLCTALPYSPELPSITLAIHPTLHKTNHIEQTSVVFSSSSSTWTPPMTLAIHPTFPRKLTDTILTSGPFPTANVTSANQSTTLSAMINSTVCSASASLDETTSTPAILTLSTPTSTIINNTIGACGPGIGPYSSGLCCSKYNYCGTTSSYRGFNCNPNFGVCGSNTSTPVYSFSYAPISSSAGGDGTGAAGIVGDIVGKSVEFSYVPLSTGGGGMGVSATTAFSFAPVATAVSVTGGC